LWIWTHTAKIMKSPLGDPVNSMGPPVWVGISPPSLPNDQEFFLVCNSTNLFLVKQTLLCYSFAFEMNRIRTTHLSTSLQNAMDTIITG
jgi:hypothetical protein